MPIAFRSTLVGAVIALCTAAASAQTVPPRARMELRKIAENVYMMEHSAGWP